jgi:hypothetical protein
MKMKNLMLNRKTLLVLTVLLLSTFTFAFSITRVNAAPKTIHVPADYPTITAAVAAASPGGRIEVAKGVYQETQILIDKPLTIKGAGIGKSVIDGGGVIQPLNTPGVVRIVATGDVTFQGFTVMGAGSGSPIDQTGAAIFASGAGGTYTITENELIGLGPTRTDDPRDFGLLAQGYPNGGYEKLVFTHNTIKDTIWNPILVETNPGETYIAENDLTGGLDGSTVIYIATYGGLYISTPKL